MTVIGKAMSPLGMTACFPLGNDRFACKPPPMRQKYKSTIPPFTFIFRSLLPFLPGFRGFYIL